MHWGDRQPHRGPAGAGLLARPARRIENRLAGADANPYLAMAASLACGYHRHGRAAEADRARSKAAPIGCSITLPRTLYDALHRFEQCKPIRPILGERFINALRRGEAPELEAYQRVSKLWEREHPLLNV